MPEQRAKKAKLRNHKEDFNMCGFVSVDLKPMCLECGAILTNDSTKKANQSTIRNQTIRHLLVEIGNILTIKRKDSRSNYPTLCRR